MESTDNHFIDALFKRGLNDEKQSIPFKEGEWAILKARLEGYEKRRKLIFILKMSGGIAAIYLLIMCWWLYDAKKHQSPIDQVTVKRSAGQKGEQRSKVETAGGAWEKNNDNETHPTTLAVNKKHWPGVQKQSLDSRPTGKVPENALPDSLRYPEILDAGHELVINLQNNGNVMQIDTNKPVDARVPVITYGAVKTRKLTSKILTLSFLFAPSINGVNNLSSAKLGNDIGVLLTRKLTARWSISSGAIYAKKLYETGFANYKPAGNMLFQYNPQTVDADCRVLDIPINFNYIFFNKGKNNVSLGTGLSSYLMLNENYHFIYSNPLSGDLQNFQFDRNRHWLSVLNFQASYERLLSSKIGISFQPYLKLPLTDIGFARVRLQTFSMAVNFNWHF